MGKVQKMELKHLLESGGLYYYPERDSLVDNPKEPTESRTLIDILNQIIRMDYLNEPILGLVSDFARKHGLTDPPNEFEDYESSDDVYKFCIRHIYKIRTNKERLAYERRFRRYKRPENYVLLASLKNYGLDPIQFWYFFLFCNDYYVNELTKVDIIGRSIKEELELFVDQVNKMNFSNKNWDSSYPLNIGEISIKYTYEIDDNKEKSSTKTITNQQAIHLISNIIGDYLKGEHDKSIIDKLSTSEPKPAPNYIKYLYYDTKGELTDEEYKKKIHGKCFEGFLNKYETESGKHLRWQKIAILKYLVLSYLNENKGKAIVGDFKEYKDCENKIAKRALITDKLKLFSVMLYLTGNLVPDSSSKITKDEIKKYYNNDDEGNWDKLKDYVWSNIKKYDINSEEELKNYQQKLALRKKEKNRRE